MVFPISPYRQSRQRMVNTFLMYVRESLEDKSVVYLVLSYVRKKIETWLVSPASKNSCCSELVYNSSVLVLIK